MAGNAQDGVCLIEITGTITPDEYGAMVASPVFDAADDLALSARLAGWDVLSAALKAQDLKAVVKELLTRILRPANIRSLKIAAPDGRTLEIEGVRLQDVPAVMAEAGKFLGD